MESVVLLYIFQCLQFLLTHCLEFMDLPHVAMESIDLGVVLFNHVDDVGLSFGNGVELVLQELDAPGNDLGRRVGRGGH